MLTSGMVRYHCDLKALLTPVGSVAPHPDNPNNGDVETIAVSIEINGMYRPLYVQKSTGYIVGGNSTYAACLELGATEVPVMWLDVDDTTAKAILLVDNRAASLARMDHGLELRLLEELAESDSLLGTGYDEADLQALRALVDTPLEVSPDAWPKVCAELPPDAYAWFARTTSAAVGDTERLLLLCRLAGYEE